MNPARIADAAPEDPDPADPVHAVGVGPGDPSLLTRRAREIVADADVVVGFETVLDRLPSVDERLVCTYADQEATLSRFDDRLAAGDRGAAVLWGDPNVSGYQFLGRLEEAVARPVRVVPGVSSVQVAAARTRTPLEDATVRSLHRRGDVAGELERLAAAVGDRHLHVLVRPYDWMPPAIAAALVDRGADPALEAVVLQDLTLPGESIERRSLGALADEASEEPESYSDRTILSVPVR